MVRLSAQRTGQLYHQKIFLILNSVKRLSQPQGHIAAGSIMSLKNSNDTVGNRTRDLPTCGAVPQPTAPPRTPRETCIYFILKRILLNLEERQNMYSSKRSYVPARSRGVNPQVHKSRLTKFRAMVPTFVVPEYENVFDMYMS
jgi:hypothetical protein